MGLANTAIQLALDVSGIERVVKSFQGMAAAQIGLNATGPQTGFLRALGDFTGTDPVASARNAYQASLSGFGLIGNAQAGNRLQFDQLEPVNYGERLVNLVKELVRLGQQGQRGMDEARVLARNTDTEPFLKMLLLPKPEQKQMMKMLEDTSDPFGPMATEEARAQAAKARFDYTLNKTLLPAKTFLLNKLANFFAQDVPVDQFLLPIRGQGQHTVQGPHAPLNANTQAVNANTMQLRQFAGLYGGGARARAAMGAFGIGHPGMFSVNQVWRSATFRLGAYSIAM